MAGTKISQLSELSTISGNENTVIQNGTTNNKVSLNKIKEFSSADSLKKTEQTFTDEEKAQIQTNIGVKSTVDVVGAEEVQDIPVDIAEDNKYLSYVGNIVSQDSFFVSKAYAIKKGDFIFGSVDATINIAIIALCDKDGKFKEPLLKGQGSSIVNIPVKYICNQDGYVLFSAKKQPLLYKLFLANLQIFLLKKQENIGINYLNLMEP